MSTAARIDPNLLAAWHRTEYRTQTGCGSLVLRIDEYNAALHELMQREGVSCAAYISADNPRSQLVSGSENSFSRQQLKTRLRNGNWRWMPGLGVDPGGEFPGENSVLVLGISAEEAIAIGRDFDQDAILLVGDDAVPRLAFCGER